MEHKKLKGKVVVVTGGTGVLGDAFTKSLAEAGADVGILGRNTVVAVQRAEAINRAGGSAVALTADVLNEEDLRKAADIMIDRFGKIDGLVNAAGGNTPDGVVQPSQDIFDLNMKGLREVLDLNLFGTLLPTQVFGKIMLETASGGSIVNISSVTAYRGLTRVLGYSLAKTAIEGYTRWFAVELGKRYSDKLRMNAIVPGFFLTEQNRTLLTNEDGSPTSRGEAIISKTPFGRYGQPDELCGALNWLLSNESVFVNGTSVVVDGGFLAYSGV
ncbi:MAG: SDR family oxidoreductase [Chitinophagaceae bacterium]|nr:MAG: SDR family oxidoreductase [Chitinophagaceae bacterium]